MEFPSEKIRAKKKQEDKKKHYSDQDIAKGIDRFPKVETAPPKWQKQIVNSA